MSDRERGRTVSGDTRKRERSRTPSGFLARKYPKYNTKFNVAWKKDFKWLKESDKGPDYALCVLCDIHIKTCYGGASDLRRHQDSISHVRNSSASSASQSISSLFGSSASGDRVTKAETLFANFVAEHNLA